MATGYKNDLDEKHAADERYNPSGSARDLYNRETDDSVFDDNANNYNQTADSSQEDANIEKVKSKDDAGNNIDSAKDQEESGGGWTNKWSGATNAKGKFDLKGTFKKNGPIGAIILLLGGGGIAITGLLSPALLLVQMTDIFTNNFNDAHTSTSVRTNAVIANKIGKAKNAFAETSDGKCGVRCKTTTMSDTMVRNLEARGFTVEKETRNILGVNRHTIQSITFPDGTVADTGNKFKAALKDPIRAASFAKVYNSRTAYFLNSKFGSMLAHKFGINKAYKLAGDTKEKFNESFRRAIGLPPKAAADPNRPAQTDDERFNEDPRNQNVVRANAAMAAQRGVGAIGAACMAYNTARVTVASVKIAKMARYASYAMVFLNAAHKLKAADGGGIQPGVMTALGDILTHTDSNKTNKDGSPNETYGLSATSSHSYRTAAYGDTGPLPKYAKGYSLESAGLLGAVAGFTYFATNDKATRTLASNACRGSDNPITLVAQCALPSLATGPLSPIAVVICTATNFAVGLVASAVVAQIAPIILKEVITANVLNLDETTKGVFAGEGIGPGASIVLGGHATSYGLTEGSREEIADYVAISDQVYKHDEAIARIEAREDPFDMYNKYSFLGSMARSLNLASYANSPLTTTASTLASTIPKSFASLTATTHAGTYMPLSNTKAAQYGSDDCPDVKAELLDQNAPCCPSLRVLDADGDGNCLPSRLSSAAVLNMDPAANKEFMLNNEYIDETTGAPKTGSTTNPENGRQFQLYVDNCVNRTDPPGETTKPIQEGQEGDYEWFIGVKCDEKTDMVNNFRTYALDEPINANIIGEDSALLPASSITSQPGGNVPGENSGIVDPDGWAFPTTAGAPLTQGYHDGHLALDIGSDPSASSVPIYSMRDGVVKSVGNMPPPYLKACESPTGTIQQTVVVEHDLNGQKYFSAYHHVESGQFPFGPGSTVKAGDRIATMGNTGCSFGRHLHIELWKDQIYGGGATVDLGAILY
jgi:hypothetical protein